MRTLLLLPCLAALTGCGSASSYVRSDTTLGRVVVYRNELYDYAGCINLATLLRERFPRLDARLATTLDDLLAHWQKRDGAFRSRRLLLGFDNVHTARNRLNLLQRRGVLARFRDAVRPGSQSWRWALGWIGAAFIAYRDGAAVPRPGDWQSAAPAAPTFHRASATARRAPKDRAGPRCSNLRRYE